MEEEDVPEHDAPDEGVINDLFDPLAEARRAFNKFDTDGNGTLDIRFVLFLDFNNTHSLIHSPII